MTTAAAGARRTYRSARRRQQAAETRALVLAAATSLFGERGWAATGMRDVAKHAGVAVETVYANFGSKPDLLLAAIDLGVVGDTEPVPLADRPEFAELGSGGFAERVAAAARLVSGINQRSWGLHRTLYEAGGSEPQLRAKLAELEARQRQDIRDGAQMMTGRVVDDDVLDGLWVLMSAHAFQLLTQVGGRSAPEYEQWLRGSIARLLAAGSA